MTEKDIVEVEEALKNKGFKVKDSDVEFQVLNENTRIVKDMGEYTVRVASINETLDETIKTDDKIIHVKNGEFSLILKDVVKYLKEASKYANKT